MRIAAELGETESGRDLMGLGDYYRHAAIPKPELRAMTKKRRDKRNAQNERACREITRKRDGGKCRIPGCKESAQHWCHIQARSLSKARRFDTANTLWLCADHHALQHAGEISISGNADLEIVITGDVDKLRFRL